MAVPFLPFSLFSAMKVPLALQGAQTAIYPASSPDVEGVSGKHFDQVVVKKSMIW
jgi:hypothetical protein